MRVRSRGVRSIAACKFIFCKRKFDGQRCSEKHELFVRRIDELFFCLFVCIFFIFG